MALGTLAALAGCDPRMPAQPAAVLEPAASVPAAAQAAPAASPAIDAPATAGALPAVAESAAAIAAPAAPAAPAAEAEPAAEPAKLAAAAAAAAAPAPAAAAKPAESLVAEDPGAVRALFVPARETTLVAQMVGQIVRIPENVGAPVAAGTPVVMFECEEQEARVRMADAEFNSTRENHEAKIRLQGLQSAGELEVALAAAAREKARSAVELARVQRRLCRVDAPYSGRVVKLHAKRFQGVNVGQPLVDIVDAGHPRVRVNVPSRWLAWLKVGTTFEVSVDETGRTHLARVRNLNARVDAVSQSIEIEGELVKAQGTLLPGMSGTARFKHASLR